MRKSKVLLKLIFIAFITFLISCGVSDEERVEFAKGLAQASYNTAYSANAAKGDSFRSVWIDGCCLYGG